MVGPKRSSPLSPQARPQGPGKSALWTSHMPWDQDGFPEQLPWPFQACSHLTRCQPGLSCCFSHRLPGTSVLLSAFTHPAFVHLCSPYTALPTWAWGVLGPPSTGSLSCEAYLAHSQGPWPLVPRGHRGFPTRTVHSWASPRPPAWQVPHPQLDVPLTPGGSGLGARPPLVWVGIVDAPSHGSAGHGKTWGGSPRTGCVLTWVRSTSLPLRVGCVSRARS